MPHSPVGTTTVRMEGGVYCTDHRSYYRYLLFVPGTAPVCRRYGITLDWLISTGRYKKGPYRTVALMQYVVQYKLIVRNDRWKNWPENLTWFFRYEYITTVTIVIRYYRYVYHCEEQEYPGVPWYDTGTVHRTTVLRDYVLHSRFKSRFPRTR
jgi:hypothetical protein